MCTKKIVKFNKETHWSLFYIYECVHCHHHGLFAYLDPFVGSGSILGTCVCLCVFDSSRKEGEGNVCEMVEERNVCVCVCWVHECAC